MAGIIGNMTAQARLRRGRKEITSSKCVYTLEPFPEHGFRPELHNMYVRVRASRDIKEDPIPEERNTVLETVKEISFLNNNNYLSSLKILGGKKG